MVTLLDAGLLSSFSIVFPFLFVFALVYAILHKTDIIGKSPAINSIIAVVAAFTTLLSDTVVQIINFIIPWFAVAIIFFILILLIFQMFGAKDTDIFGYMKENAAVGWVIVAVGIIIILAALGSTLGQQFTEAAFEQNGSISEGIDTTPSSVSSSDYQQNIINILVHPKVIGVVILFLIAIFAIALLSGTSG